MARRDGQDLYAVNGADRSVLANLDRRNPNRPASAARLRRQQSSADINRYPQAGAEPALDEVFQEAVIRLMMKSDNVTEDQLLHLIIRARRYVDSCGKRSRSPLPEPNFGCAS